MKKDDVKKIYEDDSDDTKKIFAQRLINLRKKRGLTQMELSEKLGIQQSAYARYEKGKVLPRAETIRKIADILEVSEVYLINTQDIAAHILEDSEVIDISLCLLKNQINNIPFELVAKRICEWMTEADPTTLRYMVFLVEALQSKEMGNEVGFLYERDFVETHATYPSTPGTTGKEVYTDPESMFYAMGYLNSAKQAIEHFKNLGFNLYGQKFLDLFDKLDKETDDDYKNNQIEWYEKMVAEIEENDGVITKPLYNDYGQSFQLLHQGDEKFDEFRDSDDFRRAWIKANREGTIPIINVSGEKLDLDSLTIPDISDIYSQEDIAFMREQDRKWAHQYWEENGRFTEVPTEPTNDWDEQARRHQMQRALDILEREKYELEHKDDEQEK